MTLVLIANQFSSTSHCKVAVLTARSPGECSIVYSRTWSESWHSRDVGGAMVAVLVDGHAKGGPRVPDPLWRNSGGAYPAAPLQSFGADHLM